MKNVKGARPKDNIKKALFKPQTETAKKPANDVARQKQQLKAVPIENGDLEVNGGELLGKAAKARVEDYSYDEESDDHLDSEGELNSDQKQKLRRDLAMMGFEEDDDFDEINEANARLLVGFE